MGIVLCSEVIIQLFTVFVCSVLPENDNITLISRLYKDDLRTILVKIEKF